MMIMAMFDAFVMVVMVVMMMVVMDMFAVFVAFFPAFGSPKLSSAFSTTPVSPPVVSPMTFSPVSLSPTILSSIPISSVIVVSPDTFAVLTVFFAISAKDKGATQGNQEEEKKVFQFHLLYFRQSVRYLYLEKIHK